MIAMALAFGLDQKTGIDLPSESSGLIPTRQWRLDYWTSLKDDFCQGADNPAFDAERRAAQPGLLRRRLPLPRRAGHQLRDRPGRDAGDAAAAGQRLRHVANGGKVVRPTVAEALLSADGDRARGRPDEGQEQVPVTPPVLAQLRDALHGVTTEPGGTGRGAFAGLPLPVAGKTGTGRSTASRTPGGSPASRPPTTPSSSSSAGEPGRHGADHRGPDDPQGLRGHLRPRRQARPCPAGGCRRRCPSCARTARSARPGRRRPRGRRAYRAPRRSRPCPRLCPCGGDRERRPRAARRVAARAGAAAALAAAPARPRAAARGGGARRAGRAAGLVGHPPAHDSRRARPADVPQEARPERGVGLGLADRRGARRLPGAARLRPARLRAVVPRAGRRAVAARLDHQRRALLDRAAGGLPDPAVGVRQGRDRRRAWR